MAGSKGKKTGPSSNNNKTSTVVHKKTVKSKHDVMAAAKKSHDKTEINKDAATGLKDIDALFAQKKETKKQLEKESAAAAKAKKEWKKKQPPRSSPRSHNNNSNNSDDWVDDGLGGKFNAEGYTGRVEDGVKIYKTHRLQSTKSGTTKDCPFDCDCCFI